MLSVLVISYGFAGPMAKDALQHPRPRWKCGLVNSLFTFQVDVGLRVDNTWHINRNTRVSFLLADDGVLFRSTSHLQ
jgi:hypothetical protein